MSDPDDKPVPVDAALAAHTRAARIRGAYSIEALAELTRVSPSVIMALEKGEAILDIAAGGRVLAVLGLRPDRLRSPESPIDLTQRGGD